ncbi:flagellar protein FlgN [Variovorax sp. J2P1-59]|uniref:flagella synthesis protein FlgN n=1 Tax=Variovorax flavidus TaxID=3053501 RepID=UPI0025757A1C|nr:flagellar protein FlgN [Variovorax sp. J2P1-59]MDM0074644.1 flagellar protein FlgN [Variovorax sp. J2P1-59]
MNTMLLYLHAEKSCVEEFLTVLETEEQAMSNGRFGELASISEQKIQLLDRIAELDRQRETAQAALGFEPGAAGADAAAAAGGEATRQAWTALLELAERARALNLRNGSIVYTHLDFTQKALHFLQSSVQLFYGPDGVRKTSSNGTRLAMG